MAADPATLLSLAERVEAATGAENELDFAIQLAVLSRAGYLPGRASCKPYTRSLDAALSLVPSGWAWQAGVGIETEAGNSDSAYAWAAPVDHGELVFAATPALALCAAALRARATQSPSLEESNG